MKRGAQFLGGHRDRGSVLIVVMWACLGLVAMTLVFAQSTAMTYRGAGNDLAARQADAAIEGAARYVEYLLTTIDVPGVFPDPTTYEYEAVPVGEATFWYLGGTSQDALASQPYGLVDEASKLNVNTATADMLAQLPGMTQDFAQAIVAWRSPAGSTSSAGGSVSGLGGAQSYTLKNGPFETPEEVGMVNGADHTFLYGQDLNLNGVIDPNESQTGASTVASSSANNDTQSGLLAYLTTFSREPNKRADGTTKRINVSNFQAAEGALSTLFTNTPTLASRFADVRSHFPPGSPPVRSVLEFYVRSQLKADDFAPIADALSVSDDAYLKGLVNVNTAPQEVLACIPGIGTDMAATLIAARTARATPTDTNIAWVGDALGPQFSAQAGPYLTAASFQTCADVAAVGRNGRGYRRTRFVIDNSTGTPRIIYRRDLTGLGWALGDDARQTLANAKGSTLQ